MITTYYLLETFGMRYMNHCLTPVIMIHGTCRSSQLPTRFCKQDSARWRILYMRIQQWELPVIYSYCDNWDIVGSAIFVFEQDQLRLPLGAFKLYVTGTCLCKSLSHARCGQHVTYATEYYATERSTGALPTCPWRLGQSVDEQWKGKQLWSGCILKLG